MADPVVAPTLYPDLWLQAQAQEKTLGGDVQTIYDHLVAASGGGSNPSASAQQAVVFMGMNSTTEITGGGRVDKNTPAPHGPVTTTAPNMMTPDDAAQWLQDQYNDKSAAYQKVVDDMVRAGLLDRSEVQNLPKVLGIWSDWVNLSYNNGIKNPKSQISPMEYLTRYADSKSGAGATGQTATYTSTATNVPSTADLEAGAQNNYSQALGRRASPGEAAAAAAAVGREAGANPSRTTTRTTTDAHGNTNSTSSSTGGMGATAIDDALLQQAMQNPEYAEYQAAAHYAPALFQAVSAINSAGL